MNRQTREFNPFYALVVISGVAFAVTTLAYTLALVRLQTPAPGTPADFAQSPVFQFFERRGESLMFWETGALAITAILAMGLDRWRSWHSTRIEEGISSQGQSQ